MSQVGKQAPYLDGIPVVASSADRDARFPSPDTNQRVHNLTTGYIERFDGATWLPEIALGSSGSVVSVLAKAAKGDGSTDDTGAIHAARDVAGAKVVVFPAGTYITTGLAHSVAGQQWLLLRGATLKMKDATNAAIITVSAADTQIVGYGTLEGNRANQSSDNARGILLNLGADRCLIGDGLTIQNCRGMGIHCALAAGQAIAGLTVRHATLSGNARASDNHAQIWLQPDGAASSFTDLTFTDLDIDGTPNHNGGIKISATTSATIQRIQCSRLRIKAGDAGGNTTLGIEFFASGGGLIQGITCTNIAITGENNTNANIFGFSLGGVLTIANTTGIRDVAITGLRVKDCRQLALELIATNVAVAGVSTTGSGRLHISSGALGAGGLSNIAVSDYTADTCVDGSYCILVDADATYPLSYVALSNITLRNPTNPIQIGTSGVNGLLSHINIGRVLGTGFGHSGIVIGGALTDSEIGPVDFDLTGSAALSDGIIFNNANIARVKLIRPRIKAASRFGINHNTVTADVEHYGAYVTGCGSDGIKTQAACTGMVFDECRSDSNTGTGIILGNSPGVKRFTNNRALGNVTAQINKGSATFTATPRGNQSSTGVQSGRAVLVAGTVTVSTAEVIAADNIMLTRVVTGGTQGTLTVGTITAGTSFVITSSNGADTSTIFWEIVH